MEDWVRDSTPKYGIANYGLFVDIHGQEIGQYGVCFLLGKGHPLFFLCLASSDRPRFSRFQKKKSYAEDNEGNDTLFQTIVTLI